MAERIQKLMAHAGLGSRRECEKMISNGRVRVNGRRATLGDKADPEKDRIQVDGRVLNLENVQFVYVALHKPKGVISSLSDELGRGRTTVRDLVSLPGHLYPVGRLDKQSTGLMLMTNDGDLAHKLTHPRYGHEKTYHVTLEGKIDADTVARWESGVWLDDQKTIPTKIRVLQQGKNFTQLEVAMREGRKRQIRRVANMLGHPVQQLVRQKIGPLSLGDLKPGAWRHLRPEEVRALRKSVRRHKARRRPPPRRGKRKGKRRRSRRNKKRGQ